MVEQLIESVSLLPSALVQAYAFARIFAVWREAALAAWFLFVTVVFGFVRSTLDPGARVAASVVITALLYVPYAAFSTRSPAAVRIVLMVGVIGCGAISEALAALMFVGFTGSSVSPDMFGTLDPSFLVVRVVHLGILALLLWGLYRLACRNDAERPNRNPWLFVGFPATQAILLILLVYVGPFSRVLREDASFQFAFYVGFTALCALCVIVDVAYLHMFEQSARVRRDRLRAEVLQDAIDRELVRAEGTVRSIEATARLRHDLRNHAAVVRELVRRGDSGSAREHIDEMLRLVAACGRAGDGSDDDEAEGSPR